MVYLNCGCTGIRSLVLPWNIAKGSYSKYKRQGIKVKNSWESKIKTEYLLLAQINHHKEITKILAFESRRDLKWANRENSTLQDKVYTKLHQQATCKLTWLSLNIRSDAHSLTYLYSVCKEKKIPLYLQNVLPQEGT